MLKRLFLAWMLVIVASSTSVVSANPRPGDVLKGVASYYHDSLHGRKTASGERYDKAALTAAHKSLPLGTKVRVTNPATGKSIVVKINDRGPFIKGRIIDLSRRAARELKMVKKGLAKVRVEIIATPSRKKNI